MDNTFTLQGRMEQILDPEGSLTPGTVFTAIVAKQFNTDTSIQFEVEGSGLRALVDREVVTFDDVPLQEFDNIGLLDKGNNTILAIFSSGINIEVKTENGFISVMLVGLPGSRWRTTRGLMGTFNGILSDDLIPKGGSKSIPLDSSLEDIHNIFGITCKFLMYKELDPGIRDMQTNLLNFNVTQWGNRKFSVSLYSLYYELPTAISDS